MRLSRFFTDWVQISLLYVLSRIWFLRPQAVYYDSFEYVRLVETVTWENLWSTLWFSHQPVHTGYLLPVLIVRLVTKLSPDILFVSLSFLSGWAVTLLTFFLILHFLKFSRSTAKWAAFTLCLLPLWFSATTNIVYEPWLLLWQLLTLLFGWLYLRTNKVIFLPLAGGAAAVAQSVFIGNIFFLPALGILLLSEKNTPFAVRFFKLTVLMIFIVFMTIFVERITSPHWSFLVTKYLSHATDVPQVFDGYLKWILRVIRNGGVGVLLHSGVVGSMLFIYSLFNLVKKKRIWWLIFLWMVPYFIVMQYWHAGLFGRVSMGFIVPLALLLSTAFSTEKSRKFLFIVLLIPFLLRAFSQTQQPLLYQEFDRLRAQYSSQNISVITTDSARFLYEEKNIPFLALQGRGDETAQIQQFRVEQAAQGRMVVEDSFTQDFPRKQPDGWEWQIFSILTNK